MKGAALCLGLGRVLHPTRSPLARSTCSPKARLPTVVDQRETATVKYSVSLLHAARHSHQGPIQYTLNRAVMAGSQSDQDRPSGPSAAKQ